MKHSPSRRWFLNHTAAVSSAALLPGLNPVLGAATVLDTDIVQFRPEIEPLVRLIESTPRQKLMEEIGSRVKSGASYQELLTGLFLAAIRNVQPRPIVGFKFHAVLVVHSAHLASVSSSDSDRWLPIFWALDEFKSSQARDVEEGDWTMSPVRESSVPDASKALAEFHAGMDHWDESKSDAAAAALVRNADANDVFEAFVRYAARDYRNIGHKVIFAANAWRTLQTIGWKHAEPVMRSLAYAMLNHHGEPNPSTSDLDADRPWRQNMKLARSLNDDWHDGRIDVGATQSLIDALRSGTPQEASAATAETLNDGISPQSVFDALHTVSAELLMKQSGIIALHAVTTTNAIRFLFDTSTVDETRRMLILQNAAFLPMFLKSMRRRGRVGEYSIDSLTADENTVSDLESIFVNVGRNRSAAWDGVYRYLDQGNDAQELLAAARRLIFLKGSNSHDYKFSSALLEDYHKISPAFRNQFLAAGSTMLRGSTTADNGLVARIRNAVT